ncbi:unnamed protein product [Gongylonema pulchrum]|uniref:Transposase n=1 Tax=Gongylonema pulchrum TaxID=637853 RepID=A0A183DN80_9BILA|nr:unnamed protein product [Gongylonema pulchrum]
MEVRLTGSAKSFALMVQQRFPKRVAWQGSGANQWQQVRMDQFLALYPKCVQTSLRLSAPPLIWSFPECASMLTAPLVLNIIHTFIVFVRTSCLFVARVQLSRILTCSFDRAAPVVPNRRSDRAARIYRS